jgi:hypothetical protein
MIKFFRKIRQRLLSENLPTGQAGKLSNPSFAKSSAGKYLIYAIGEIILVVMGILIALQIKKAAFTEGILGINYLLSIESYRISDLTFMLNNQEPEGNPKIVYYNDLAKNELGIDFKPARVSMNQFST